MLVFAGAAPALVALGAGVFHERSDALGRARAEALAVADQVALQQQSLIDSSRVMLSALVELPELHSAGPACNATLGSVLRASTTYANLGVADAAGTIVCSALPAREAVNIADRLYFREALQARAFSVGEYQIGRVTGEATVNTGHPLVVGGELRGIVFAAIRLSSLAEQASRAALPQSSAVTIMDRNGTVLARIPHSDRYVGRRYETALAAAVASRRSDTLEARGLDGVRRLYGHAVLPGPGGGTVGVLVGIPMQHVLAEADRQRNTALAVLAVVTGLAALAGWLGSRRLVRPVTRLADVARRLESGELSARADLPALGGELDALARSFDEMAASLERRVAALRYHTHHDQLTDLPNRRALEEAVVGGPLCDTEAALLLLNLVRFREVAHTLGPESADLVVREAADRLRTLAGDGTVVARVGGNEFGILIEHVDRMQATSAARSIIDLFKAPMHLGDLQIDIHVRVGVAPLLRPADPNEAIRRAEVAERECGERGLLCLVYDEHHDPYTDQRLRLIGALRGAHERGEMRIALQPIVDTVTGRPAHCEALLRWRHPTLGDVPPNVFIPLAEQFGLIGPLTTWVIREALRSHLRLAAHGLTLPVAVNISASSLADQDLPATIQGLLLDENVDPQYLSLEVTETAAMSNPDEATTILTALSMLGLRIAVDDFGTGHSSLAYLSRLPIDTLKIDQSFITALDEDDDAGILVRSTIELAHKLRRTVVAEGVEHASTRTILKAAGCDYLQGYLIGTPMSDERLIGWAERQMARAG